MTLTLLVRYWRETAILAFALTIWWAIHQRDQANIARGHAEERARVADSTLRLVAEQRPKIDTIWRHDSVKVVKTTDHLLTLHDTVLAHITDTTLVKVFVDSTVQTIKACRDVLSDCDKRHALDLTEINALRSKLSVEVIPKPARRCGLGFAGGYGFTYTDHSTHLGPALVAGLSCRL